MIEKRLFTITVLVFFSIVFAACGSFNGNAKLFPLEKDQSAETLQSGTDSDQETDQDAGQETAGQNASEDTAAAGEQEEIEYLTCFAENPHPVAQDITDRFDISYQQVEDWYCQGNSFEDIMLALMTSRLWEIDAEDALLAHKNKTWDQLWEELEESQ